MKFFQKKDILVTENLVWLVQPIDIGPSYWIYGPTLIDNS